MTRVKKLLVYVAACHFCGSVPEPAQAFAGCAMYDAQGIISV